VEQAVLLPIINMRCSCVEISMDKYFARNRTCIQCGKQIEEPSPLEERWCYEYWCISCEAINRQPPPPYVSPVRSYVQLQMLGDIARSLSLAADRRGRTDAQYTNH